MTPRQQLLAAIVLGFVCGTYYAGSRPGPGPGPGPGPSPTNRPVLAAIIKLAKLGLWVAAFMEPAPPEPHYVVHATFDDEGHRTLNNAGGW